MSEWMAKQLEASEARANELEVALAAETKRREGAEDELYAERLAHTDAVTRAETAERERAEARGQADAVYAQFSGAEAELSTMRVDLAHARAAAEKNSAAYFRAEADNAALLRTVIAAHPCEALGCMTCLERSAIIQRQADHPGAALLERMRELEAWMGRAVRGLRNLTEIGVVGGEYAKEALRIAQDGADALKVPRE